MSQIKIKEPNKDARVKFLDTYYWGEKAPFMVVDSENVLWKVRIRYDEFPLDPREDMSNLGTMYCAHRRYDALGDKKLDDDLHEEFKEKYEKDDPNVAIWPLYLLDHSGLHISTGSFNDPWDSGFVGWIVATKEDWAEFYGKDRPWDRKAALQRLDDEVEEYEHYVAGEYFIVDIDKWQPHTFSQIPNTKDDSQWDSMDGNSYGSLHGAEAFHSAIQDQCGNDYKLFEFDNEEIWDKVLDKEGNEEFKAKLDAALAPIYAALKPKVVYCDCGICGGKQTIPLFEVDGNREGKCLKCGTFIRVTDLKKIEPTLDKNAQ